MRRTTKARIKANNNNNSSFSENEMMGLGLFGSSSPASSSASSNLSPLALPFTLGRSNHNHKFNSGSNPDSHFNSDSNSNDGVAFWSTSPNFNSSTTTSQGLLADSIRTATVPSTYSTNPNPITTPTAHNRFDVYSSAIGPNSTVIDASFSTFSSPVITQTTHNWSSMNSSVKSGLEPVNQPAAGMNPNPQVIDASFSKFSNPSNTPRTHNWSSMSSGIKSGLDHVNPPAGHLFGMNPSVEPHTWSLGHAGSDDDATMMGLNFNLLQDYGSSQANYSQSLFGSKYSGKADGARGKDDSSMFGGVFGIGSHVTGENSIGPSIIGHSHSTSPLVSGGISNDHTFPRNDSASQYLFDAGSVVYDSLSDMSITSKTLDFSSSIFNKHNLSSSHNSLQEKESYQPVGFDYKSSLNSQVPDIKSAEEVNSGVPLSEHLDHHNPGEDSPCWKGVPTHFSSSGSQEDESAQHPMKKLQKNSGEDVPLHMGPSFKKNVEDAAKAVPAEGLDANMVVKALNSLSELLVLHYSKDGCGLEEQDQKALDHVIANLNACVSRKSQVDTVQKCSSPQHIPSNMLHEDTKNDQFDKNIEDLQDAYARDEHLPKDYNMVQKIKKILDDNIEGKGDLPSDPVLYKNLWLEAEAELCVSGYRARLHRAKRELGRAKPLVPGLSGVASDIKKVLVSDFSPTAPEPLREAAGSKTVNKHGPDLSFPVGSTDDVENSVMARLSILKSREESCPINVKEKEPANEAFPGNELQSSGVAEEPHIQHHHDTDNAAVVPCHNNQKDDDHAIMARWNILKSRYAQVSEVGTGTSMTQNQVGSPTASSFGWEYVDKHE